jgi:hypothetical protein
VFTILMKRKISLDGRKEIFHLGILVLDLLCQV